MNEHHRSEIAREYVREFVEQNLQLLQAWLLGVCPPEVLGAALISSELKKFYLNGEPDLRGLAGPYKERLFREAPGGELAARQFLADCISSGHGVPKQLGQLCRELLLGRPIGESSFTERLKRGPKTRNVRRDYLVWSLTKRLQNNFRLSKRSNDAREDDPDFPDSALEIILQSIRSQLCRHTAWPANFSAPGGVAGLLSGPLTCRQT